MALGVLTSILGIKLGINLILIKIKYFNDYIFILMYIKTSMKESL